MQRAVGTVRAHNVLVARARERAGDTEVLDLYVRKIAEHRGRRSDLHCSRVVGLAPARGLCCMASRTDLGADEVGRIVGSRRALPREKGTGEGQQGDPKSPSRVFGFHRSTEKGIIPSDASPSGIDFAVQ